MVQINEFKATVGKYPTGITIISTSDQGKLYGFTANSFTSVSLSPFLISFCLNVKSGSMEAFKKATHFAINILAHDQIDISSRFAAPGADKFKGISFELGKYSDCPLIHDSVCWIECSKYEQFECGDHIIFIGEVKTTKINNYKPPLVYFAKSYRKLDND